MTQDEEMNRESEKGFQAQAGIHFSESNEVTGIYKKDGEEAHTALAILHGVEEAINPQGKNEKPKDLDFFMDFSSKQGVNAAFGLLWEFRERTKSLFNFLAESSSQLRRPKEIQLRSKVEGLMHDQLEALNDAMVVLEMFKSEPIFTSTPAAVENKASAENKQKPKKRIRAATFAKIAAVFAGSVFALSLDNAQTADAQVGFGDSPASIMAGEEQAVRQSAVLIDNFSSMVQSALHATYTEFARLDIDFDEAVQMAKGASAETVDNFQQEAPFGTATPTPIPELPVSAVSTDVLKTYYQVSLLGGNGYRSLPSISGSERYEYPNTQMIDLLTPSSYPASRIPPEVLAQFGQPQKDAAGRWIYEEGGQKWFFFLDGQDLRFVREDQIDMTGSILTIEVGSDSTNQNQIEETPTPVENPYQPAFIWDFQISVEQKEAINNFMTDHTATLADGGNTFILDLNDDFLYNHRTELPLYALDPVHFDQLLSYALVSTEPNPDVHNQLIYTINPDVNGNQILTIFTKVKNTYQRIDGVTVPAGGLNGLSMIGPETKVISLPNDNAPSLVPAEVRVNQDLISQFSNVADRDQFLIRYLQENMGKVLFVRTGQDQRIQQIMVVDKDGISRPIILYTQEELAQLEGISAANVVVTPEPIFLRSGSALLKEVPRALSANEWSRVSVLDAEILADAPGNNWAEKLQNSEMVMTQQELVAFLNSHVAPDNVHTQILDAKEFGRDGLLMPLTVSEQTEVMNLARNNWNSAQASADLLMPVVEGIDQVPSPEFVFNRPENARLQFAWLSTFDSGVVTISTGRTFLVGRIIRDNHDYLMLKEFPTQLNESVRLGQSVVTTPELQDTMLAVNGPIKGQNLAWLDSSDQAGEMIQILSQIPTKGQIMMPILMTANFGSSDEAKPYAKQYADYRTAQLQAILNDRPLPPDNNLPPDGRGQGTILSAIASSDSFYSLRLHMSQQLANQALQSIT